MLLYDSIGTVCKDTEALLSYIYCARRKLLHLECAPQVEVNTQGFVRKISK